MTTARPASKEILRAIEVGDIVTRMLAGVVGMELVVTEVDDFIYIGERGVGWKFHKETGCEVDEDLGWDGVTRTGSFISNIFLKHDEVKRKNT